MWQDIFHQIALIDLPHVLYGVIANDMCVQALGDFPFDPVKGTPTNKEDILRIDMDILLVWVLPSALWRYVHHRPFQQFQESLLHAFTTHVTGDAGIIALTSDLVNLINEDNTSLCSSHVIVGNLQQTGQDALHVLTHIASLCKDCRIYDGKRYVKKLGNGLGKQGLSRTRAADHDDITLFDLHAIPVLGLLESLIMIID